MWDALHAIDLTVYRYINLKLTSAALDPIQAGISNGNFWLFLLAGSLLTTLALRKFRAARVLTVLSLAVGLNDVVCAHLLKPAFQRVRPCHYLPEARRVDGICGSEFGLPSNHASNGMAATAVLAYYGGPAWLWVGALTTVLVGYSRVYLSVHFPGDVLAGFLLGALLGIAIARIGRPFVEGKPFFWRRIR